MPDAIERALAATLRNGSCDIGEVRIKSFGRAYLLYHRDDEERIDLRHFSSADEAIALARFDDGKKYRPLKTAPNLRHGWRLQLANLGEVRCALDYLYPGRLAAFAASQTGALPTTSLRETLSRQTGMYRVAAKISDAQINEVVANLCRSDGGCLRTILWNLDASGRKASAVLPPEKFDPRHDQARRAGSPSAPAFVPLLCQEACNLLVGECRKAVQSGKDVSAGAS